MRRKTRVAYAIAGLAAASVVGVPAMARAQSTPACDSFPNPVYISGSSASQPVLQALASVLGSDVSIIYQNPDSCFGLNDAIAGEQSTESGTKTMYLAPPSVQGGGTAVPCTLSTDTTMDVVDIGVSDVFPATCQANLNQGGVTVGKQVEILGPIQAMTIAVPALASPTSISDKAAYVVFGYDATTFAVPLWNQAANIFVRPWTSGTLNMIGTAIGLSATKWANAMPGGQADGAGPPGQQKGSTGAMFSGIAGVTSNVDQTIGILSDEAVIQNNAKAASGDGGTAATAKVLAFQYQDQTCGYLPDSTTTSFDKLNVRQGRYAIWGPLHFVANVDSSNNLTGPHAAQVAAVLNYFVATGPNSGTLFGGDAGVDGGITADNAQALIDAESTPTVGGVVPWCAMEVVRTTEIGPEASYQPDAPCGCHFEKIATGQTVSPYCKACPNGDSDCNPEGGTSPYPVCRYGYCEAQ